MREREVAVARIMTGMEGGFEGMVEEYKGTRCPTRTCSRTMKQQHHKSMRSRIQRDVIKGRSEVFMLDTMRFDTYLKLHHKWGMFDLFVVKE